MEATKIEGRIVRIARPDTVLYPLFTDLTNFTNNLPPEYAGKAEIESTPDTITAKVQGFHLGIQIAERTPFSQVIYTQLGGTPIQFKITVNLNQISTSTTEFQLIMEAQLPGIYKAILGGKLKEVIDKITDQIESAMGVFPTD